MEIGAQGFKGVKIKPSHCHLLDTATLHAAFQDQQLHNVSFHNNIE